MKTNKETTIQVQIMCARGMVGPEEKELGTKLQNIREDFPKEIMFEKSLKG